MKEPATSRYRLRRLLQFHGRTLLVLVLLSSIAMGWCPHQMQNYYAQQEAIAVFAGFAQHMAFEARQTV